MFRSDDIFNDLKCLTAPQFKHKYETFPWLRRPINSVVYDIAHYALDLQLCHHIPFLIEKEPFYLAKYIAYCSDDALGESCIHVAHINGWINDINEMYNQRSALSYACEKSFPRTISALLSHGADPFLKDSHDKVLPVDRCTDTHLSDLMDRTKLQCYRKYRRAYHFLYRSRYTVNNDVSTASELLEVYRLTKCAALRRKILIFKDSRGNHLLHYAVKKDKFTHVREIIGTHKEFILIRNDRGKTPGFYCQSAKMCAYWEQWSSDYAHKYLSNRCETYRIVWARRNLLPLSSDYRLFVENVYVNAPRLLQFLYQPCELSHQDLVKASLYLCSPSQFEAKLLKAVDNFGNSVLHAAMNLPHAKVLIEKHPSLLHTRNIAGETPLHRCVDPELGNFMMQHGAHPELLTKFGEPTLFCPKVPPLKCLAAMHVDTDNVPEFIRAFVVLHQEECL